MTDQATSTIDVVNELIQQQIRYQELERKYDALLRVDMQNKLAEACNKYNELGAKWRMEYAIRRQLLGRSMSAHKAREVLNNMRCTEINTMIGRGIVSMKNHAAVALGSMRSPKKAKASAENGKKGGRPKKSK